MHSVYTNCMTCICRRMLHVRGLAFEELLHSIMGFNNSGSVAYLVHGHALGESSSLLRGLHTYEHGYRHSTQFGAGRSSVDSLPVFEAVGRRIDPSQWTQLQFGLFSVPTSGPQLVYQRLWYVLFCLWNSAYKRSLAAYRKE